MSAAAMPRAGTARLSLHMAIEPLPLKTPFRISGHAFTAMPALDVVLDAGGHRGRGEAAGVYYLDDTPQAMWRTLEHHREALESGLDRDALQALLPAGGARNAVDCALWELQALRAGTTVAALAGVAPLRPLMTTFTIGADDPATVAWRARDWADARALKLKLDGEADADIERIRALRAARPEVWFGVDANQGYAPATIEPLLRALSDAGASLLEQPFARGREADLDGIDVAIDIAADESIQDLAELEARARHFDVVNIKLDKCGGLTEALAMERRARQLGLKVMVGNMLGSSLAAAPAFVLGQRCDLVDLDGPTFIARDRVPGVRYADGEIDCPHRVWGGMPCA
ncbi:dipeptide epimerase [Marilutibacter maris]|nr:dipeptide epimerase [Lysobacter maris]